MKINIELLICVLCLNPNNYFLSFNKDKLLELAHLYPSDFNQFEFSILASQLENYFMDVQNDRDFF
jgi:hypothetical protein